MTPAAMVCEGFSRAASGYESHASVQTAAADRLAKWLPGRRTGRALEMGAGTGVFTRRLLPWAGELVVSDGSPAMCEAGRAALPMVTWRPMRAEAPEGGTWQWIFSSSMLQWVDEPEAVFAAWRSALAPGGRVIAGLFAEGSLPELRALTDGWSPVKWRSSDEWLGCLRRAGLRVVRHETEHRRISYPSAHVFLRTLHGVGAAPVRRLSSGALRRLLADYDRLHGGPDGAGATWTMFRFEAERG